jgi:cytochrome c553
VTCPPARALLLAVWLQAVLTMGAVAAAGTQALDGRLPAPQSNYILGCGGCHGVEGVSNSRLVPDLAQQVGYFLNDRAGREYLVRVPNVAFYPLSDQDLAGLLNYMVFHLGGSSIPAGAKPYTAAEVARLRRQPLTETSLEAYRAQLIDTLGARFPVPPGLRVYGADYRAAMRSAPCAARRRVPNPPLHAPYGSVQTARPRAASLRAHRRAWRPQACRAF